MINALTAIAQGTRWVYQPGLRRYIFFPILVNFIVYAGLISIVWQRFDGWLAYWMSLVPSWLEWLSWLIWPLFLISLIAVVFFSFTLVTHLIAAPFYGFLAAKVEVKATGQEPSDDRGLTRTAVDTLKREMIKLGYILPRVAVLFVISWIPVLNLLAPVLWGIFSAWMMAITYLDYPMDNNKVSFADMRSRLSSRWWHSLSYGGLVMLLTLIPLANLFLLPGAVAGAVLMWDAHYRQPVPSPVKR